MDLPNGWSRHTDEHGRTYYHDTATGATSWNPPPPRPTQPQPPPPPPPQEAPTAPPLSHSGSYRNSGYHAYPPAHPSATPDYSGYSYGQYPPHYPYHQPPPGVPHQSPPSHPPPTSLPPHSSYPSGPSGAPPPHNLPPSPQPPGAPTSHPPSSAHPPPGASPPYVPSSHAPPGPPGSHAPPPSHPPPPGPHLPQYSSYPMPTHSYQPAYHHQDPINSPSPGGYPSQEQLGQHAYPPHSSSYSTHVHMPPPHPGNPAPPPGGYPHASPPHVPIPPPHGSPSSHPLPPPPPQGYPSGPDASHPPQPPGPHLPPNHQASYHPPPSQQPSQISSQLSHVSHNASGISAGMSNMSLGLGPASKFAQISLEFRAISLRDRDLIGKSDPVVNVYEPRHPTLDSSKVTEWKSLGSTETLKNNVNPTWAKRVNTRYYFERLQPLRFEIVDVDNFKTMKGDHLGTVESTLAEIVRNGVVRLKLNNKNGGTVRGELIIRAHDDNPEGKVRLQLSLSGKGLDKKDFLGKSDPYYKLMQVIPGSGGTSTLYQSEEKMNDLNPTWKPHTLMLPVGKTPWEQVSMVVEVYDWDRYTPHDLIGETTFTLRDLTTTKMFPIINKKKKAKKGSRYKNSGELVVHRADAVEMPGFVSYLQGGLRLDFIVAVDFTASNRPPDNVQSLHYMGDPNQPSQYYQALQAVGTTLQDYLSDGCITALGFGAKLPGGTQEASFDFSLNGQADARVYGVQGLLDAYKTALSNVSLAGPTYFTPIIKNAMGVANSVPVSQANQHFAVLLILTDGIITDLSLTIDTIIEASHSTPIAIVIVGVGKADFRAMKRLDADDYKLRNDRGDKVAKHDIVQFTKYDPSKPIEHLASDVLHEVPHRVVEFLADAGIKPNPPIMQQPMY